MTIDEAIVECKQNDLYQYAEWLEELKMLREHRNIGNTEGYNKGYKNAIDDVLKECERFKNQFRTFYFSDFEYIAEQLKGSVNNE